MWGHFCRVCLGNSVLLWCHSLWLRGSREGTGGGKRVFLLMCFLDCHGKCSQVFLAYPTLLLALRATSAGLQMAFRMDAISNPPVTQIIQPRGWARWFYYGPVSHSYNLGRIGGMSPVTWPTYKSMVLGLNLFINQERRLSGLKEHHKGSRTR